MTLILTDEGLSYEHCYVPAILDVVISSISLIVLCADVVIMYISTDAPCHEKAKRIYVLITIIVMKLIVISCSFNYNIFKCNTSNILNIHVIHVILLIIIVLTTFIKYIKYKPLTLPQPQALPEPTEEQLEIPPIYTAGNGEN